MKSHYYYNTVAADYGSHSTVILWYFKRIGTTLKWFIHRAKITRLGPFCIMCSHKKG